MCVAHSTFLIAICTQASSKLFNGVKFFVHNVPGYTRKRFKEEVLDEVGALLAGGISGNVDYLITTKLQMMRGSGASGFASLFAAAGSRASCIS